MGLRGQEPGLSLALTLSLPLDPAYLAVTVGFAERAGAALGLAEAEAGRLTLAAEEVFAYLARTVGPGAALALQASAGGAAVRLAFRFPARNLELRLLNLTARVSPESEADLEDLGLLLAARMVDRLALAESGPGELTLTLTKDKAYPAGDDLPPPPVEALASAALEPARPEEAALFARLLQAHAPAGGYPPDLVPPGKLADLVAAAEVGLLLALGPRRRVGGGFAWRRLGSRTVEGFGPYLFAQPEGSPLGRALVEGCLQALAKTEAVGLVVTHPTPALPQAEFERLGELNYRDPQGRPQPRPFFYRHLAEDPGAAVWAHPDLAEFLQAQYRRLYLPRDVVATEDQGQARPAHSVLACRLRSASREALLEPLWDGLDAAENLDRHLHLLGGEGFRNLFLTLDLGLAWPAAWVPAVLAAGFKPALVLPHGGRGDLVFFQLQD